LRTQAVSGRKYRSPKAEEMRLRHLYRGRVLKGGLSLPPEAQRRLVGPDCAYHLDRTFSGGAARGAGGDIG